MTVLLILCSVLVIYLLAYKFYGGFLANQIFALSPKNKTPAYEYQDDTDYVPTKKGVVFGHHFTSIAGTGPIVGPAIAVIWGYIPALLWVVLGSIFIGAVHDFSALVVSLRSRGLTVGDISGRVLTPRVRYLFLLILFLALTIVLAIFGLVIAAVFRQYPASIFPCIFQIPLAVLIGYFIHRKGRSLFWPSAVALLFMYLSVVFGNTGFLADFNSTLASWPLMTWVIVLLGYCYIASVLPVWSLLQPRDYINSLQLFSVLGLLFVGLVFCAFLGGATDLFPEGNPLVLSAPAFRFDVQGAPPIFPFLFITIACGAFSGFHCLVSSGSSSKQLKNESDAQFVGYGSMLTEGFLATLVILACVAGLGMGVQGSQGEILSGEAAWISRYATWSMAQGLAAKVSAFVDGSANFLIRLGIGREIATALMGVFVASFAATTLDSAARLQRYVLQELGRALPKSPASTFFKHKHGATAFAVCTAALLAAIPAKAGAQAGSGGLLLWPLFGATNQILGGLAFVVILFWMWRRKMKLWFVLIPAVLMLIIPTWALILQVFVGENSWFAQSNYLLVGIGGTTLLIQFWVITEAIIAWPKVKGLVEEWA